MSRVYYNEHDPKAAAWLRELIKANLIPAGVVDERSIVDVNPYELTQYTQHHFFAGIGGWAYALRLAGWPDHVPVWTGSCPCQPFSSAARGRVKRLQCDRHLWPHWKRLIAETPEPPRAIFGEQVAGALDWQDEVCNDLEVLGYAVGTSILPACSIGADHARQRLYFVGHANGYREPIVSLHEKVAWMPQYDRIADDVLSSDGLPGRMAIMCGFGNAIVPQVAAEFIKASVAAIA